MPLTKMPTPSCSGSTDDVRRIAGRARPWRKTAAVAVAVAAAVVAAGGGCGHRRQAARAPAEPRPDKFTEMVRARAPFDLSCPAEQVTISSLGETARGVRGCNRQASYSCVCTYHVWFSCTQAVCTLDATGAGPAPSPSPTATPAPRDPT